MGWRVGWYGGAAVTVIAAGLILDLIALGRRISGQAREIDALLQRSRENTDVLFEVPDTTNRALGAIAARLRELRETAG